MLFRSPFDTVGKKVKVSSQYGSGTEATLSSTVVKAVLAYCRCRDGSGTGAVGRGGALWSEVRGGVQVVLRSQQLSPGRL